MKKIIDWFWDGVLLKDVRDKITYKLFIFMYSMVFVMVLFVNLLCIPAFIKVINNGLNFEKICTLSMPIICLVLITFVLFAVIKGYKKLSSN
ncbi:hypothetical protein D3C87_80760 [compost metagenome]